MIVTKVIQYDKKKVLVEIDEHFTFPIYKTELQKFHLVEGNEVLPEFYRELTEEILPKRVKVRAMKLLEKRPYTRETLRRKLLEGKYPNCFVETALDYVTSYGYIDDMKYAEDYINCHIERRSKKQILQELIKKGVAKEVFDAVWLELENSNELVDEAEQIKAIFRKKHFEPQTADYAQKRKMFQYLYRKGYDINCIQNCMQFEEEYVN